MGTANEARFLPVGFETAKSGRFLDRSLWTLSTDPHLFFRKLSKFFHSAHRLHSIAPEPFMDAISTSAASGMRARMESLEMLANNLANVETGGFKADREFFSLYTGDDATSDPQTGDVSTVPVIESQWTDLSQGVIRQTANPLDFAIQGEGMFAVQTAGGVRYTRNGSFRLSPSRTP